jgi:hypothetical protein
MLDDFMRKIRQIQRRAEQLDGEHSIPFTELFNDEFMLRNTDFPSIDALFEASGFEISGAEDFAAIPDAEWDAFVVNTTRFTSWEEMKSAAAQEWVVRRMEGE